MKLNDLKVQSFVTGVKTENQIQGGVSNTDCGACDTVFCETDTGGCHTFNTCTFPDVCNTHTGIIECGTYEFWGCTRK